MQKVKVVIYLAPEVDYLEVLVLALIDIAAIGELLMGT